MYLIIISFKFTRKSNNLEIKMEKTAAFYAKRSSSEMTGKPSKRAKYTYTGHCWLLR